MHLKNLQDRRHRLYNLIFNMTGKIASAQRNQKTQVIIWLLQNLFSFSNTFFLIIEDQIAELYQMSLPP